MSTIKVQMLLETVHRIRSLSFENHGYKILSDNHFVDVGTFFFVIQKKIRAVKYFIS